MKSVRLRLSSGDRVIGSWISSSSPVVAELMAQAGFDFLTVDVEHSAVDLPQTQALLQAIRSGNPLCAPLVRVAGCDYAQIKRYMDAGASGIICPLVNTPGQAQTVVDAVKYPPEGRRGVGFCRANKYGVDLVEAVARSNRETIVAVQVEHIQAVESIDQILAVKGIDVAFIGPYDLTASMGITAKFDHPEYRAAKRKVLAACRRHRVVPGIHVVQPDIDQVRKAMREGYRFVAYSLDITMLTAECGRAVKALKALKS